MKTHLSLSDQFTYRVLEGQVVLLKEGMSGVFTILNPHASEIWVALLQGETVNAIAARLARAHKKGELEVKAHIDQFLSDLKEKRVLREEAK